MSRSVVFRRSFSGCRLALLTSTVLIHAGVAFADGGIINGGGEVKSLHDGDSSSGFFVESGTLNVTNAILRDFTTTGGSGSGGAAGFGGAIFVGTGATAIVSNTTFFNDVAVGGTGGAGSLAGGTLDNILTATGSGATGSNGTEFQDNQYLFGDGDGNGVAGTN